ncbi:hypothetical protein NKG94_46595 [Micromonospora sp. M12]
MVTADPAARTVLFELA